MNKVFKPQTTRDRILSARGVNTRANPVTDEELELRINLGRVMREARRAKGFSQADVAKEAAATPQAIGLWEQGKNATTYERMLAIARHLDFDVEAAKLGELRPYMGDRESVAALSQPEPQAMEQFTGSMSLYGTHDLGEGKFAMEGAIAQIKRPPGLRMSKKIGALNVPVDNMHPRYRVGELIYFQERIAAPRDDVILEVAARTRDEASQFMLVEWFRATPSRLVCRQHNPDCEIDFERDRVVRTLRVLMLPELIG